MFEHKKKLLHPVKVERPNPQYAVLMQEQLGGCNGEVKAAMQYLSQSFRAKDPVFKDLFLDIGTEELSHMEMVAETINLLNGGDVDYKKVDAGEIETMVTFGLNPALVNSSGNPWTADYVTVTGDLAADLLADSVPRWYMSICIVRLMINMSRKPSCSCWSVRKLTMHCSVKH